MDIILHVVSVLVVPKLKRAYLKITLKKTDQ